MTLILWVIAIAIIYQAWKVSQMADNLARMTASVAAMATVNASAIAMISGIAELIREAIEQDDAAEDGALSALADQLDSQTEGLAAAVEAAGSGEPPVDDGDDSEGDEEDDDTDTDTNPVDPVDPTQPGAVDPNQ